MNETTASEEEKGDGVQPSPSSEGVGSRARLTRLRIHRFRHVKPGTELRFDEGINVLLGVTDRQTAPPNDRALRAS